MLVHDTGRGECVLCICFKETRPSSQVLCQEGQMLLSPRRLQAVGTWEVWGWGSRVGRGSQAPGPNASHVCLVADAC